MTSDEVRFGLIGFGLFGRHHAQAIEKTAAAKLSAIAVRSGESQSAARQLHPRAAVMGDYRELLARDDVDVVSVAVPNAMHYQVARSALEAGKHVLLEKPMALRISDCDELVEMTRRRKRILAVGHELRLSSLWGGVRELIESGAIGRPQHALIELSRFPYRLGSEGWRWDIQRVGNWILEEPIHFFDLARWYLGEAGEPESVYARANSRHAEHPELRDNFSAVVNFPAGAYAVISQTLAGFGHHQSAKIAGTEGTIWAQWHAADARAPQASFSLQYGLGDQIHQLQLDKPAGELLELAEQIAAVARCVRTGNPPPCTATDGRWSTLLCLAAQRSVDRGEIVELPVFRD